MDGDFFIHIVSIILLLLVSSFSFLAAKRVNMPYTIFVFLMGVAVFFLKDFFPILSYISGLELTGELVFFVFLPILIFESAYNMPYKKIVSDAIPIMSLAVFGLIISTTLIAFGLRYGLLFLFGIDIPISLTFLFGAIISATDPVAVIAIFKEVGVPKRLTYIFEGESLMNDATAVALFLIILEIIRTGVFNGESFLVGLGEFTGMLVWGILWGAMIGGIFSKLVQKVNDIYIEITFILLLAHITFISSEVMSHLLRNLSETSGNPFWLFLQISPIIATTISAITMGNYGRFKISPKVRSIGDYFYEYLAFVSNSLIFLLMGLLIGGYIDLIIENILPIMLAIFVVAISRAISIYLSINPVNFFLRKEDKIPAKWRNLLSYGSLRGAIAITMILIAPKNINLPGWDKDMIGMTPYEFLAVFVTSCVIFTLFFKALSMGKIVRKMGLTKLSTEDNYTMHQVKDLIDKKMIEMLKDLKGKAYVIPSVVNSLKQKYINDEKYEAECVDKIDISSVTFKKLLKKYALGIERNTIIKAFSNKEVDELSLKIILNKIENQYIRLERGLPQIKKHESWFDRKRKAFYVLIHHGKNENKHVKHKFLFYRARAMTALSVISELKNLRDNFYNMNCAILEEIIGQYEKWYSDANRKKMNIFNANRENLLEVEKNLIDNQLIYTEQMLLKKFYRKHILHSKTYGILKREFFD